MDDPSRGLLRREYLAALPVGALAGCTSAEETPPGIGEIVLENRRDDPVDVTIGFQQDGEAYETRATVPGLAADGPNSAAVVDEWMGEHGAWELTVGGGGVDGSYGSEAFDERFYDYDRTDCIQLVVRIDGDGVEMRPQTVAVECP